MSNIQDKVVIITGASSGIGNHAQIVVAHIKIEAKRAFNWPVLLLLFWNMHLVLKFVNTNIYHSRIPLYPVNLLKEKCSYHSCRK